MKLSKFTKTYLNPFLILNQIFFIFINFHFFSILFKNLQISKSLTLILKFLIYKKIKIYQNRKIIMGSVMTCCTDSEETKPEGEEGA